MRKNVTDGTRTSSSDKLPMRPEVSLRGMVTRQRARRVRWMPTNWIRLALTSTERFLSKLKLEPSSRSGKRPRSSCRAHG